MTERHRIAVVIPALNEKLRIREVVESALEQCPRVILVDDGSSDGTPDQLAGLPLTVIRHPQRSGKGAALRSGFRAALALGAEGVLTMDGDGQHLAADIPRLLDAARRYPDHIVIGARLNKRARQPIHRRLANEFGDWGIAWATGYRIADTQSGQRYYPRCVCELLEVSAEGFVFEADILIQAARRLGTRCVAVPIESRYSGSGLAGEFRRSHFRPLLDLWRIAAHVAARIWSRGQVVARYFEARRHPPLIHHPEATVPAAPCALGASEPPRS